MATFTNQTKNTTTVTNQSLSNYAVWDDNLVAWDDSSIAWDAFKGESYAVQAKNTSVMTNQVKN